MKLLIVGQGGAYNHGCEAIIRSTMIMLGEHFKDLTVTMASFDHVNDGKYDFGFPITVIPHTNTSVWRKWSADWFLYKLGMMVGRDLRWKLAFKPLRTELKRADIVISIGGDNYTEDYKMESLKMFLGLNTYVKQARKKLVIWGASIGPFSDEALQLGVIDNLKQADLITVREQDSYDYLSRYGLNNIIRVSDPAFILPTQSTDLPSIMQGEGVKVIGFNVSPLLKGYDKVGSTDRFSAESKKFLETLLKDKTTRIVLVPHVNDGKGGLTDDHAYLTKIYSELSDRSRVYLVPADLNAAQLKFIISKCHYYFGARTHSTIGALSSGVPTISIGYSAKAKGINQDLFGCQDYVLDIKDYSSEGLMEKYKLLCERSTQIRTHLNQTNPEVCRSSYKNADALMKILIR